MDLPLAHDSCGLAEEGSDVGGGSDAVALGPDLCGSVVDSCSDVIYRRHAWDEKVEVGNVRRQLHIVDG